MTTFAVHFPDDSTGLIEADRLRINDGSLVFLKAIDPPHLEPIAILGPKTWVACFSDGYEITMCHQPTPTAALPFEVARGIGGDLRPYHKASSGCAIGVHRSERGLWC